MSSYQGFLIQYEVSISNSSTKLLFESWCWPKLHGIIIYNRDPINRLLVSNKCLIFFII